MTNLFRTAAISFTLLAISGGAALAGCDSSCPKGKCRYDSATGYYCSADSFQQGGYDGALSKDTGSDFKTRINSLKIEDPDARK